MNRNIIRAVFTTLLFSFSLFSCKENKKETDRGDKDTNFSVEIPLDKKGKPLAAYTSVIKLADSLKLDRIEKGFDSLQIRIWHAYSLIDSGELVVLKKVNGKWSANLFILNFSAPGTAASLIASRQEKSPISGWDRFIKRIIDLKITSLPDISQVAPDIAIADGDAVLVEISTMNMYRFYEYLAPDDFRKEIPEAGNMADILGILKTEFNFQTLNKSDSVNEKNRKEMPLHKRKIVIE